MKPMRYAHSDGHTDVCFDSSGRYMLTCGRDGDVRIWEGIEDDNALSHRLGESAFAIAFKNDRFFTATDSNSVQASKFPDGMPDGLVTRFTAPVNHMVFNADGSMLVAASSDFTVKLVEVESSSHKVYRGHKAPVLSIALDPKEQFVASSSCDGTVQVWSANDQSEIKTLEILDKYSDISLCKSLCRLCWSANGEFLLIPVAKEICVYRRDSWELVEKISHECMTGLISILSLSSDGRHLAAGCVNGVIAIIDWQKHRLIAKHRHEKELTVTAIAWRPTTGHHLAFCDNEGQLGYLEDALSPEEGDLAATTEAHTAVDGIFDHNDDDMLMQASGRVGLGVDFASYHDDDDADSIDLGAIKKSMMPLILGDEESNASDSVLETKPHRIEETMASHYTTSSVIVEGFKPTPFQKSFQPGCTPKHLSSRFMESAGFTLKLSEKLQRQEAPEPTPINILVLDSGRMLQVWNSIGVIRQFNTDDENSIDIEFHNTATHHAMHIANTSGYTIADLSVTAVVLAANSDEESSSKLTCLHFGSWDSAKEWSTIMPGGELIEAVTASETWLTAATSCRNVRLFTVGGVQRSIFTIPGPVVCLTAHKQCLMTIYHAGLGLPGDQNLACRMLSLTQQTRPEKEMLLPISPKSTLCWAGFSTEGTPFTVDSEGIVRLMNYSMAATWTQVANTRDHEQYMRNVLFSQSQLNETVHESQTSLQRTIQEALMKLFALSVRSEREYRAVEVCELMADEQMLQLSIKYATRQRHLHLAQRISRLAQVMVQQQQVEEKDEEEDQQSSRHSYGSPETISLPGLGQQIDTEQMEPLDSMEEEEKQVSGSVLKEKSREMVKKKSTLWGENPFKICSQGKESANSKGTQIFDSMKKAKERAAHIGPLPVSIKQAKGGQQKIVVKGKAAQQATLVFSLESEKPSASMQLPSQKPEVERLENQPTKKPASAFDLWWSQNQDKLQREHPQLSKEELGQTSMKMFLALPREERQVWLQKARCKGEENGENQEESAKKRKRSEEIVPTPPAKTPLLQYTNSKLAAFIFPSKP